MKNVGCLLLLAMMLCSFEVFAQAEYQCKKTNGKWKVSKVRTDDVKLGQDGDCYGFKTRSEARSKCKALENENTMYQCDTSNFRVKKIQKGEECGHCKSYKTKNEAKEVCKKLKKSSTKYYCDNAGKVKKYKTSNLDATTTPDGYKLYSEKKDAKEDANCQPVFYCTVKNNRKKVVKVRPGKSAPTIDNRVTYVSKVYSSKNEANGDQDCGANVKGPEFYCTVKNNRKKVVKVRPGKSAPAVGGKITYVSKVYPSKNEANGDQDCSANVKGPEFYCTVKNNRKKVVKVRPGKSAPTVDGKVTYVSKVYPTKNEANGDQDCSSNVKGPEFYCTIKNNRKKIVKVKPGKQAPTVAGKVTYVSKTYSTKNEANADQDCSANIEEPKFYCTLKNGKKKIVKVKPGRQVPTVAGRVTYVSKQGYETEQAADADQDCGVVVKDFACYYCDPTKGDAVQIPGVYAAYKKASKQGIVKCEDITSKRASKNVVGASHWRAIRKELNKDKNLWRKIGALFDGDQLLTFHESAEAARASGDTRGVAWCKGAIRCNEQGYDHSEDKRTCESQTKSGYKYEYIESSCECKEVALECSDEAKSELDRIFSQYESKISLSGTEVSGSTLDEIEKKAQAIVSQKRGEFANFRSAVESKFKAPEYTVKGGNDEFTVIFNNKYECGGYEFDSTINKVLEAVSGDVVYRPSPGFFDPSSMNGFDCRSAWAQSHHGKSRHNKANNSAWLKVEIKNGKCIRVIDASGFYSDDDKGDGSTSTSPVPGGSGVSGNVSTDVNKK